MITTRNYDETPEQTDFPTIPDGEYMFELTEKKDTESKDGDVMIKIILSCMEEGEYENIKVRDNIMLPLPSSPAHKIIGRSKRFLHAIGEPFQGNFEVDTDNWVGKTVRAKVSLGEYNGNPQTNINRYLLPENESPNLSNNTTRKEAPDLPF